MVTKATGNRLCVYNLNNGQKTFVTESFESGVDDYCWNNDSQSLYFIGVWHGTSMVYSTNLNGDIKKLTDGMYDYGSVAMAGDKILPNVILSVLLMKSTLSLLPTDKWHNSHTRMTTSLNN